MKRRLIFKRDQKDALGAICVRQFWMLKARIPGDPAQQIPFELHYSAKKEDIQVVYVDDPISECRYVIVSGEQAEKACGLIKEKIEIWTDDELFESWEKSSTDSDRIDAILRIGVAAPWPFDARYAKRLREGVADADRAIREASLAAIAYQDWPELDDLLHEVARSDSDDRCRNRAALMLEVRTKERSANK